MPTYIEYQLDENTTILIEAPAEETGGIVKAARGEGEPVKVQAKKSFSDALRMLKSRQKYFSRKSKSYMSMRLRLSLALTLSEN